MSGRRWADKGIFKSYVKDDRHDKMGDIRLSGRHYPFLVGLLEGVAPHSEHLILEALPFVGRHLRHNTGDEPIMLATTFPEIHRRAAVWSILLQIFDHFLELGGRVGK